MTTLKTSRQIADALGAFDNDFGETVLAALQVYAEHMRATAREAAKGTSLPDEPDQVKTSEDGQETISLRPTAGGFARMAGIFTDAAAKADEAHAAFEQLTGRTDEDAEDGES